MKVSSMSRNAVESGLFPDSQARDHQVRPILQMAQRQLASLLKTMDRIGTSIALGEKGDLEAADAFRRKNSGE